MDYFEPATKAKTRQRVGCIFAVLVCFALIGSSIWYRLEVGWTPHTVERAVAGGPQLGSLRPDVEIWLKGVGWTEYYYLTDLSGNKSGNQTMPELAGLSAKDLSDLLRVDVPNPKASLLLDGSISVYFFFDHQGKLVGHYVHSFVFFL